MTAPLPQSIRDTIDIWAEHGIPPDNAAFAAELLCPIEALSELLAGDFSDDAIQGAADTFGVSPMTVTVQLLNNRVMQSDELNGLDPDWAVA